MKTGETRLAFFLLFVPPPRTWGNFLSLQLSLHKSIYRHPCCLVFVFIQRMALAILSGTRSIAINIAVTIFSSFFSNYYSAVLALSLVLRNSYRFYFEIATYF